MRPITILWGMRPAAIIAALLALTATACSGVQRMPPTPNVLRDGSGSAKLSALSEPLRKPDMEILYVTDRSEVGRSERGPEYGYGRATALAFGTATVSLKPSPSWEELVRVSGQGDEHPAFALDMTMVDQVGEVVLTPQSLEVVDGQLKRNAESAAQLETAKAEFLALVKSKLDHSPSKDVYLYVHGFNNSFYDAVARAAILWHSISRQGVFIAYTWPAGYGGPFGYFYDRESGEFTIFHLREMLKVLVELPELERLHIIAHSRGTDVATTALRELNIGYRAQGLDPHTALKLETLMLAAPDLDVEVFAQRFWLENLGAVAKRTVVYFSSEDDAIGVSSWLFGSKTRIGALSQIKFSPAQGELLKQMPQIQLVECQVSGFASSHAYVFGNPAAMSDVVAVLRDRRDAGAESGRPLQSLGNGMWLLDNAYFADVGRPGNGSNGATHGGTAAKP
ncbi:MAG: alpha/beta hydrolase [Phycisphaerales bacterium]|nr:alpha/beta hydrolase [Phycisphaerales bacterium]